MERDVRTIFWIQALRAFVYGLATVIVGSGMHLSTGQVGLFVTAMLVGMPLVSLAVGTWGERIGRRRLYTTLFLVLAAAGAVPAFTAWLPLLIIAALTGTLSPDPNESGPITSLEQAMLGQAPAAVRTRVFGRYNAVAYLAGALGALAAGGPHALRHLYPHLPADQRWLVVFPVVGLICAFLASRLSEHVEAEPFEGPAVPRRPLERSRGTVSKLAALFALDSFAGGFIVQLFLVHWLSVRFHANVDVTAAVFFAAGLLQAASAIVAGWLAGRIGMLNTMVFTHLPSNVLLIAVALAPNLPSAVVLLLARFMLSQMDVPARQAYLAAMVDPEERTAAAAYTNTARYVARPFGQVIGSDVLMQNGLVTAPLLVAGSLKILYDGLIFGTFRKVPLPESS